MGRFIVVCLFSLAVCWVLSSYISLGGTVFAVAGVSVSAGVLLVCVLMAIGYKMVAR